VDFNAKVQFLQKLLGNGKFSAGTKEFQVFCPWCQHHKPKCFINLETDYFQCFPCGKGGRSLLPILKKVGSQSDISLYLDKFKAKCVKTSYINPENAEFRLDLPPEYVPIIDCKDSVVGKRAYEYLIHGRKITDLDILRHKIGTAHDGAYANRVIFPSFDRRGLCNFFTSRTYEGQYWHPETPRGYKFSIILNELNLDFSRPVVLVEGFGDMYKSIDNTAPLDGSSLPEESLLFKTLVNSDTPVYMALDPDARHKSIWIAKKFMKYDIPVYDVCVEPYKDVGMMTKDEFIERFKAASLMNNNQILRERMRSL
jgi:hypothetical protein